MWKRDIIVWLLWRSGSHTNRQLGEYIGLTQSSVSRRLDHTRRSIEEGKNKLIHQVRTIIKVWPHVRDMLERLNREIKRRTRVASLFPNEASLLRLVSAILMETSEEWETGRKYLTLEYDLLPNWIYRKIVALSPRFHTPACWNWKSSPRLDHTRRSIEEDKNKLIHQVKTIIKVWPHIWPHILL